MRLLATALLVLCAASALSARQADWTGAGGPRLRYLDARVESILRLGVARSNTLRTLVARIDASRVVVYLGMRPDLRRGLTGQLTWVGDAGLYRYVRVALNPVRATDELIAALAHELQHVVEVIDDPAVRDEPSLQALYRRIGYTGHGAAAAGWETHAAQSTGTAVRRELAGSPARTLAALAPTGRR